MKKAASMKNLFENASSRQQQRGWLSYPEKEKRNSFLILSSSLVVTLFFATTARADNNSPHTYMGVGSCSSSNCHGNVAPVATTDILQNEYVTWQKHDKHSGAFAVLGNSDSTIIAKHMGIASAQKEPLCLKCHSTYVPDAADRGEKFQAEDGVSCEACHGPAGGWLSSHTTRSATHEQNVKNGMFDLVPLGRRSNVCMSCHLGTDDKTVDHRLIAAGHPRLAFELDTFESILPRHWNIDKDYRDRKMDYHSASAWLHAQVSQAHEELAKLTSKKRSTNGAFNEFTMFNCYECHHSLTEDQWKKRDYDGHLGEPTLNLPALLMLEQALNVLKPQSAATLHQLRESIQKDFHNGNVEKSVRAVQAIVDDKTLQQNISDGQRRLILKKLTAYAANTAFLQYETAEQLAMGISSLVAENENDASALKTEIDGLYDALKVEENFAAEDFTKAAKKLHSQAADL
jgi:hypothetical protein